MQFRPENTTQMYLPTLDILVKFALFVICMITYSLQTT